MSKTKNIVIGILVCLLIGALGFITYDKFIAKDEKCKCKECEKCNNQDNENDYEKLQNELFYNDLLGIFLKHFSYKDVDSFDNEEIENYVYFYYLDYALQYDLVTYKENDDITYNVSKKEVDALVLNTFGKKDFKVSSDSSRRDGIRKLDDNTYQIYTFATASYPTLYKFKDVIVDSDTIKVEYTIYSNPAAGEGEGIIGTAIFNLTNNEGGYIVNSIKFNEVN